MYKKIIAVAVVLVMVLALCGSAMAADKKGNEKGPWIGEDHVWTWIDYYYPGSPNYRYYSITSANVYEGLDHLYEWLLDDPVLEPHFDPDVGAIIETGSETIFMGYGLHDIPPGGRVIYVWNWGIQAEAKVDNGPASR